MLQIFSLTDDATGMVLFQLNILAVKINLKEHRGHTELVPDVPIDICTDRWLTQPPVQNKIWRDFFLFLTGGQLF